MRAEELYRVAKHKVDSEVDKAYHQSFKRKYKKIKKKIEKSANKGEFERIVRFFGSQYLFMLVKLSLLEEGFVVTERISTGYYRELDVFWDRRTENVRVIEEKDEVKE